MPLNLSTLLELNGVELGQEVYFPSNFASDITINNRRYLRGGLVETDPTKFDPTVHQGGSAGSSTASTKGGTAKYIRIT